MFVCVLNRSLVLICLIPVAYVSKIYPNSSWVPFYFFIHFVPRDNLLNVLSLTMLCILPEG